MQNEGFKRIFLLTLHICLSLPGNSVASFQETTWEEDNACVAKYVACSPFFLFV